MTEVQKKKFHYGWLVVIGCCILLFGPCCFTFNAAGIYYDSVAEALGVGRGDVGLYISIVYLVCFITLPFVGKLFEKYDARILTTISVILIAVAFFGMSIYDNIYGFYISGVLLGAANSLILYLLVPVLIGRWFKKHVGLLIGIGMAFTGIGGMIWQPVAAGIITDFGYQSGYLMYAIVTLVLGLPASLFLIRSRPSDKGIQPFGYDIEEASKETTVAAVEEGVSAKTALKSPLALVCIALYAGLVNLGLTVNYYVPSFAGTLGHDLTISATVGSVVMFGSLFGKVLLGWTNDRSVPGSVIFGLSSGIIGLGLMLFLGQASIIAVYVGAALFGIFFASATTTTPQLTRKVFGNRDYAQIYSYVTAVCAILAAFGSAIWGFIFDNTGSYSATFGIDMGFMALCFILAFAGLALGKKLSRD